MIFMVILYQIQLIGDLAFNNMYSKIISHLS